MIFSSNDCSIAKFNINWKRKFVKRKERISVFAHMVRGAGIDYPCWQLGWRFLGQSQELFLNATCKVGRCSPARQLFLEIGSGFFSLLFGTAVVNPMALSSAVETLEVAIILINLAVLSLGASLRSAAIIRGMVVLSAIGAVPRLIISVASTTTTPTEASTSTPITASTFGTSCI